MSPLPIKLKRVYEAPSEDDGLRILVERLWPRGVSKAAAAVDHWAKDLAPTPALRIWFGHRPERWEEFRRRYALELEANHVAMEALRAFCAKGRTTFVFAAKDVERNGAVVLREYLLSEPD
ncbi:MAG: DUF488 domain-containing protein [Planctomycetota bacterium]|jgi:uncharacterized protein YeaO (DUF488 family)